MTDNHTSELASGMQNEETDINIHSVQLPNEEILRQISAGVGYLI